MADGATYQLSVILRLTDRLSSGGGRSVSTLKQIGKEGAAATKQVDQLQRSIERRGGASSVKRHVPEIKAIKDEAKAAGAEVDRLRAKVAAPMPGGRTRDARGRFLAGEGGAGAGGGGGRGARRRSGSLADDLRDDLITGAVGYGMVRTFTGGVRAASDFETAVLNLRSAYQEVESAGGLSGKAQEVYLKRLGALSKELGNDLQGNTGDYAQILAQLKRAGVDTETVLGGAGRAAAYLANVSGALVEGRGGEQAKQLGQFGKAFKLRPEDFQQQVNLISALQDRFDLDSSELMQGAKYFATTATSLGMTGSRGATDASYLFAAMKRQGLEGGLVGTNAAAFFQQYLAHADKRATLKKETGVDFEFFDRKGEFLGMENVFKQMEKLRKFSSEQRLTILNDIFGSEGGRVGGAVVELGAEGYRQIAVEANKAVSVNEKIAQQMTTYAAKAEAAAGSWENLKATAFTPMMDSAKPVLDSANAILSKLQEFSSAHPTLSRTATLMLGIGGAVAVVSSGLRTLKTLSNISDYFGDVSRARTMIDAIPTTRKTRIEVDDAKVSSKVGRIKGILGAIPTEIKITAALVGAEAIYENSYSVNQRNISDLDRSAAAARQRYDEYVGSGRAYTSGIKAKPGELDELARMVVTTLNSNRNLEVALGSKDPELKNRAWWTGDRPYGSRWNPWETYDAVGMAPLLRRTQPQLQDPAVLGRLIANINQGKYQEIPFQGRDTFVSSLKNAFPEQFDQASKLAEQMTRAETASSQVADSFNRVTGAADNFALRLSGLQMPTFGNQNPFSLPSLSGPMSELLGLSRPAAQATDALGGIVRPASSVPGALGSVANAAQGVAGRLNSITITPPRFEPIRVPMFGAPQAPAPFRFGPPTTGAADAGAIKSSFRGRTGAVGAGDVARAMTASGRGSVSVPVNINLPPGAGAADDPQRLAQLVGEQARAAVSEAMYGYDKESIARYVEERAQNRWERA